jgi:hypothetical protein
MGIYAFLGVGRDRVSAVLYVPRDRDDQEDNGVSDF